MLTRLHLRAGAVVETFSNEGEAITVSDDVREVTTTKCSGCGADVQRLICLFCGREVRQLRTLEDEREALFELHDALRTATSEEAKVKLLKGAWVPAQPELLVEAGLQCLPLIEDSQVNDRPAVQRLEGIAARLRVRGADTETERRALAEFEARIARFDRADRRLNWTMTSVVLAILAAGVFGVWSCTHR